MAARSVTTFRALLGHARRHGVIESSPATGARRFPDNHRNRRLSLAEIGRLGVALRDGRSAGLHPTGLAMVRVLLLTGFRIGEARGLRWDWIDHEQGCVRFPDTKSGPQVRVVGRHALDLLTTLPAPGGSPFVFPADQGVGPFTAAPDTLRRLCAMAGLADAGVKPSVGSVGDSYDNALAETINGLYKTEVINRGGPWADVKAIEFATLQWVDWFNTRRLLGPIGNIPPAEAEARYHETRRETTMAA